MIENYTDRAKKLSVQKEIYSLIPNKTTFIGLCGPNPIEYLKKIDYRRFVNVIFYETNLKVYNSIIEQLGSDYPSVKVYNKSINSKLGRTKAFYDLDYCRTLNDVRVYLDKISKIEDFSITFCTRNFTLESTLKILASHLGHQSFRHWSYKDGSPMVSILVSKKLF